MIGPLVVFAGIALTAWIASLQKSAPANDDTPTDATPDATPDAAPTDTTEGDEIGTGISTAVQAIEDEIVRIIDVVRSGAGFGIFKQSDGTVVQRVGNRNWRNNNPGNIEFGDFARAHGAIGSDGRFAVFPDYDTGRAAMSALLFDGRYSGLTLTQAITRYAPPTENDTLGYQRAVLRAVGGSDLTMSAYSADQRAAILDAMQQHEGFIVGTVASIPNSA